MSIDIDALMSKPRISVDNATENDVRKMSKALSRAKIDKFRTTQHSSQRSFKRQFEETEKDKYKGLLGTQSLKESYSLKLPDIQTIESNIENHPVCNLNVVHPRIYQKKRKFTLNRDFNGEIMTEKAVRLARLNLW
jgi:hypothetical protein